MSASHPTGPQAQEVGISELLALSLAATQGNWSWSENGNIVTDTPLPGCDAEIAAVYTERDDDKAPDNAAFLIALVAWFRANASTLATPARVVSDEDLLRDLRWRIEDVREMLMSYRTFGDDPNARLYGCDEWSTPTINLQSAINKIDDALSRPVGDLREKLHSTSSLIEDMTRTLAEHPDYGSLMMYAQGWLNQIQQIGKQPPYDRELIAEYLDDYAESIFDDCESRIDGVKEQAALLRAALSTLQSGAEGKGGEVVAAVRAFRYEASIAPSKAALVSVDSFDAILKALATGNAGGLPENHLPVHVHCIKDFEQVGTRCMDTGACHHGCTKTCFRKGGCVPLSIAETFLNDDWTIKTTNTALQPGQGEES